MFSFTIPLNKTFILKRVAEEDIFERYLGLKPDFHGSFCNPLREDKNPGCGFYLNKQERIKFKDPGGGFNWDCFNVVEYLYKCDFKTAMGTIARDFGILEGIQSNPRSFRVVRAKEKLEIRIQRRDWFKEDKIFWFDRYYQNRGDLSIADTSPVSHAWYLRPNGVLELFYTYTKGDPCYAYHFENYDYKLYFPFRDKKGKFRQTRGDIIQGLKQLPSKGHILVITKSFKDVMCLNKLGKKFDLWAIAPMSETQLIEREIIDDLLLRFDYIFTLFDFDRTGIRLMRKYEAAYKLTGLFFGASFRKGIFVQGDGGIKDTADCLHINRWEKTEEILKQAYNTYIN